MNKVDHNTPDEKLATILLEKYIRYLRYHFPGEELDEHHAETMVMVLQGSGYKIVKELDADASKFEPQVIASNVIEAYLAHYGIF